MKYIFLFILWLPPIACIGQDASLSDNQYKGDGAALGLVKLGLGIKVMKDATRAADQEAHQIFTEEQKNYRLPAHEEFLKSERAYNETRANLAKAFAEKDTAKIRLYQHQLEVHGKTMVKKREEWAAARAAAAAAIEDEVQLRTNDRIMRNPKTYLRYMTAGLGLLAGAMGTYDIGMEVIEYRDHKRAKRRALGEAARMYGNPAIAESAK